MCIKESVGRDYVQDKVREGETGNPSRSQPGLPGTGREGALGYERYIAGEHMDKVSRGTRREGGLGRYPRVFPVEYQLLFN